MAGAEAADPSRVEEVLRLLDLDQKAALTAGTDVFSLAGVPEAGVPPLAMTDGPNGARGPTTPRGETSPTTCVPCGSALGATWDPALVHEVGALLGRETRAKGCRVLLAPTVNLVRSPLAGRTFECYAEDPLLSGHLAAAFVRGAQGEGVATTVKHLVANEAETDRLTSSSVVDERTLRELYLVPFEWAVRQGGTLGVMTGYNRLNGTWCGEHPWLLAQVLRGEWGFDGFVVSDWYAATSTVGSTAAGLDVEMPGPARAYGPALARAVRTGDLAESLLDDQVRRILGCYDRLGLLGRTTDEPLPRPPAEERRRLARRAAAASFVLLRNDGVLPLSPTVGRVALIGPGAERLARMGGGSAEVRPDPTDELAEALGAVLGEGVELVFAPGADLARAAEPLAGEFAFEFYEGPGWPGQPVHRATRTQARCSYVGRPYDALAPPFSLRATGTVVPAVGGPHRLVVTATGRVRVRVGGEVVVDGFVGERRRGRSFLGLGTAELTGTVDLVADRPTTVTVEYDSDGDRGLNAFEVGWRPCPPEDLAQRAVAAAAAADVAVVVVSTGPEWESEGFDRPDLALPAGQDELVERVAAVNDRTVVVVNTGAPVAMAWADRVGAVLQAWFGGQEMAGALAAVLCGVEEPGGRLPVTLPYRVQDTPAYGNFPGEDDEVRYGEGLLVGYRWYEARQVAARFAFGHGLSYTTFELGAPRPSAPGWAPGQEVVVRVPVTNTGNRRGSEVVQCYVEPPPGPAFRPPKELRAFAKIELDPGETGEVTLVLDGRSFARWQPGRAGARARRARLATAALEPTPPGAPPPGGWVVDGGTYVAHVGRSSVELCWPVPLDVAAAVL